MDNNIIKTNKKLNKNRYTYPIKKIIFILLLISFSVSSIIFTNLVFGLTENFSNSSNYLNIEKSDIKIDQFRLLRELIYFGEQNFEDFPSFLQGIPLTEEEIEKINKQHIKSYSYHYPDRTDDDVLYGENR